MIKEIVRTSIRALYYLINNGRRVKIKGVHAAAGRSWIVNSNYVRGYYSGNYEPAITQFINAFLSGNSVFVDIGAHAGYYSLIAACKCPDGRVISFEPAPANFNFADSIRKINGLENWTVIQKGVGAEQKIEKFSKGPSSSMGKVSDEGDSSIQVTDLDHYLVDNPVERIDLIKIDVEGYAGNVFRGAAKTITNFKPVILLENHRGSDELEVAWSLLANTYDFFDFDSKTLLTDFPKQQIDFLLLRPKMIEA